MHLRFLLFLCLLSLPAAAQNKGTDNTTNPQTRQGTVPKGRQPAMERHTRTTWRYHSGPKRNAVPGDTTRATAPSNTQSTTDAVK